jgi:hypothetical protein
MRGYPERFEGPRRAPYNRGVPSDARHPRAGAEQGPRSTGPRIVRAWSALDRDRRLAATAAVLLFATMLLPWYQQNAIVSASKTAPLVSQNLSAFAVFSFIEAAVLLVAVAVLFLLYQRADGRTFNLPGGDGTVIFAAGLWAALLLVLRLFDKPGITHNGVAANVGIQWGIFFALAAAGLLAYAGSRMRAARRPEPPLLRREPRAERPAAPRGERLRGTHERDPPMPAEHAPRMPAERPPTRPAERPGQDPAEDVTVAAHPADEVTVALPSREQRARSTPPPAQERPPYPPAPVKPRPGVATRASTASSPEGDQLSFEDPPPRDD